MTELHDTKERVLFSDSFMGNYTYEVDLRNFKAESSMFAGAKQHYEISNFTYIQPSFVSKGDVNIVNNHHYVHIIYIKVIVNILPWTLYFDGSKSKEGSGASFLLIDPQGNKKCIACRLEFNCTNNME